jgi:hypothetical protein
VLCAAVRLLGGRAPIIEWVGRDTAWDAPGTSSSAYLKQQFPDVWGERIVHRPPVSPEKIASLQAVASFNIVPSTWDVFNFTVVESMASGRPTAVSAGAGAHELIEDGHNGYVFSSEDAGALASTLDRMFSEGSSRIQEIGRNAQAAIDSELDPKRVAEDRLQFYSNTATDFKISGPVPVEGWLGDICRPGNESIKEFSFLNNVSLGTLVGHILARSRKKLMSWSETRHGNGKIIGNKPSRKPNSIP